MRDAVRTTSHMVAIWLIRAALVLATAFLGFRLVPNWLFAGKNALTAFLREQRDGTVGFAPGLSTATIALVALALAVLYYEVNRRSLRSYLVTKLAGSSDSTRSDVVAVIGTVPKWRRAKMLTVEQAMADPSPELQAQLDADGVEAEAFIGGLQAARFYRHESRREALIALGRSLLDGTAAGLGIGGIAAALQAYQTGLSGWQWLWLAALPVGLIGLVDLFFDWVVGKLDPETQAEVHLFVGGWGIWGWIRTVRKMLSST